MSQLLFTDEILALFPQQEADFHELEKILELHGQVEIREVALPHRGDDFDQENIICRLLTFTFAASIRSERLLESIIREFNELNLHAVYSLVRSHLELAALMNFASKNVRALVAASNLEELDKFLEQLVLGNLYMSKARDYPVKPFHIGSVVRELEEISPRIPRMYYFLSEFTHPNMGALVLSAELDEDQGVTRFGRRRPPSEQDFMQTVNLIIATGQLALKAVSELLLLEVNDLAGGTASSK